MRCFEHIAQLIRTKRIGHPQQYSQSELSRLLGYKSGQFISNVERGMCSVPLKKLGRVSQVLSIHPKEIKQAILKDQEIMLGHYLKDGSRLGRPTVISEHIVREDVVNSQERQRSA